MPDLKAFAAQFPMPKNSLLMNSAAISPLPYATEKVIHQYIKKLQEDVIFDHMSVFSIVDQCRDRHIRWQPHRNRIERLDDAYLGHEAAHGIGSIQGAWRPRDRRGGDV